MGQAMIEQSDEYRDLPNTALCDYFRKAGDMLADEAAILGAVIRNILSLNEPITNKALILQLIFALESTDDIVKGDIIRKTLEIVVDHTLDDL